MKPGETQLFLQHLSQQTMFIDVWDGDSLLPLGSTAVDLKVSFLKRSYMGKPKNH